MAITTNGSAGSALSVSADLAATISDESGTGVVVFNTLPTFGTTGVRLSGSTSGTTTVLSGATAGTSVLTLPVATDTLVGKTTTDTLTNKTLTSPVLTTPSISNINAAGDLIVGTADNTIGIISIGTTGQTLTVAGGTATWATPAAGTTANDQAFAFAVQVFA
jgi:hypothetical protein